MSTEPFTWTSPAGVDITLPPMRSVKAGMLRRHRNKGDIDFMFSLLEDLVDEAEMAKIDDLDLTETETLFSAWQKAGGVGVGESSGSST